MANNRDQPEQPRHEPEIIPPGDHWPDRDASWPPPCGHSQRRSSHRIYVGRIGPLGFALFILIVALFGGIFLLVLIGAALIWLPVLLLFAVIGAVVGLIRRL
jgi:hypothetical protein